MERKFVILEVELPLGDNFGYCPVDADLNDTTWIDPRHVIDAKRLRYDVPKLGEKFFSPKNSSTWVETPHSFANLQLLILDPPKEEDEIDRWAETMPSLQLHPGSVTEWRDFFRRMPRGGKP